MATPILMPKAGQSMTEGRIVSWLKKEGDQVARGEALLEIETDKANLEVEALEPGVLRKIFHAAGETVPVLSVIGVVGAAGEAIDFDKLRATGPPADANPPATPPSAPPPAAAPVAPPAAPAPRPAAPPAATATVSAPRPTALPRSSVPAGRVFASPLARRMARERGVELSGLRGSGPGGRILRGDVEKAPSGPRRAAGLNGADSAPVAPYPPASPRPPAVVPMAGMRKAIAAALTQSKQLIPHFYMTVPIDMTRALELKREHEANGVKVSVNDLIVRATSLALLDEPRMSCRVFADRVEYPEDINIGVAVGSEEGLVVPVVLRAGARDLPDLAAETRRVIEAAGAGKLIGSGQGTFTISNLGMFGVESFTAIINPPEGAILAVGGIRTEVVPLGGGLLPRPVLRVTLSSDHRAIDGMLAARFLARLRHLLESAERL